MASKTTKLIIGSGLVFFGLQVSSSADNPHPTIGVIMMLLGLAKTLL